MSPENGAPGGDSRGAARTAAVAAASGAAVLVARRAFGRRRQSSGDALSAGAEAAWNAARDVLLPALEEGASAIGRYVAERAPEAVRESILPRFFEAFQEARERLEGDEADRAARSSRKDDRD